jgi:indolepyruvate ferredoxin oxidoreductase beta subunit
VEYAKGYVLKRQLVKGENKMAVNSVIIVGVGGQGTLLASRIIGKMAMDEGYDVKVSEVHGMSQRGGSVETYVKYGDKVWSPVINEGEADVVLAFEELEAARFVPFLKKDGTIIANAQKIDPMPVINGKAVYPDNLIEKIKSKDISILSVDALQLANEAGSSKSVNVVLIGVMAKVLGTDKGKWLKALKETVPGKYLDMNIKAFELGYSKF